MCQFDPHPRNQLGTGALDPDTESRLLAQGMIFAATVTQSNGHQFIVCSRRSLADVRRDWETGLQRLAKRRGARLAV